LIPPILAAYIHVYKSYSAPHPPSLACQHVCATMVMMHCYERQLPFITVHHHHCTCIPI
jgi:hypothetical protein